MSHLGFVVSAYAVAFGLLAATTLFVLVEYRGQRRALDAAERRGGTARRNEPA